MYAIDTHCHFWPAGFLSSVRHGQTHFGWSGRHTDDGDFVLEGGAFPAKAHLPVSDLATFGERIASRVEQQAIGMEAVMLSGFLWNYQLPAAESVAFAREVNDELAQLERDSDRHVGLGHLPLPHAQAAIDEVDRAVRDLGIRHFGLGTTFDGRNFDHPDIAPVIDAIAEAGATLSTHPVYFDALGTPERLTSPLLRGGLATPIEAGLSMATIITSGVLDRHPDFRVWVSHGGGAAMYAMGRLDRRWSAMAPEDRPTASIPTDYLRRFWYGNLLHREVELEFLIAMVGTDRITIGTDYPFEWDHVGGSANWIRGADFLDAAERRQILWENAVAFLDVEPPWTEGGRTS